MNLLLIFAADFVFMVYLLAFLGGLYYDQDKAIASDITI
jgi:hypothetical protein